MPGFTEVENRIITKYSLNLKLSRSLTSIREVMENIWANEAPRIVKDYTDHGEEHSERVACFVEKILKINPNAEYSQNEIYLLLAGIYLHDIGMQCDIVKYPEIKRIAESLGANFEEAFTARTTNEYSPEQQKEIRKNHQFLSAAWIDYLYKGKHPVLSHGIKSIPFDLVDDLMDVCKFHSKLSINDCPDHFKSDPNSRKKLVASLLRFADELDINSTRVNIETVKIFSITPENSVYWWLHKYTKIVFVNDNKVYFVVNLCPEDFNSYSSFVREDYVTNFKNKNRPVLDVLVEHRIPIVIDNNSDVMVNRYSEKFPLEITTILDEKMRKSISSSNFKISSNKDGEKGDMIYHRIITPYLNKQYNLKKDFDYRIYLSEKWDKKIFNSNKHMKTTETVTYKKVYLGNSYLPEIFYIMFCTDYYELNKELREDNYFDSEKLFVESFAVDEKDLDNLIKLSPHEKINFIKEQMELKVLIGYDKTDVHIAEIKDYPTINKQYIKINFANPLSFDHTKQKRDIYINIEFSMPQVKKKDQFLVLLPEPTYSPRIEYTYPGDIIDVKVFPFIYNENHVLVNSVINTKSTYIIQLPDTWTLPFSGIQFLVDDSTKT